MNNDFLLYAFIKEREHYFGDDFQLPENMEHDKIITEAKELMRSIGYKGKVSTDLKNIFNSGTSNMYLSTQIFSIDNYFGGQNNTLDDDVKLPESIKNSFEKVFYWARQHLASHVEKDMGKDTLSIFDYLKIRTAFAHCLQKRESGNVKPFTLVCGDISGIQSFIYNIHSSKTAKSLKGRSFYLTLLLDAVLQKILYETKTPPCNVLYSNGGKFYLMIPNTKGTHEILANIRLEIEKNIFNEHKASIYFCLGWATFDINKGSIVCDEQLNNDDKVLGIGDIFKLVTEKAENTKKKQYSSLLSENYDSFFEGKLYQNFQGIGMGICAVSGYPTKNSKENALNPSDNMEDWVLVLPQIKKQIEMGLKLKDCEMVVRSFNPIASSKTEWIEPLNLGVFYTLSKERKYGENTYNYYYLNPKATDKWYNKADGFWFYGGNQQALNDKKQWKDFTELAEPDKQDLTNQKQFNKLCILRMDVDDLAQEFVKDVHLHTLAIKSTLLDHFFSGYLNTIRNKYAQYLNILYSGGDDVFVVGRWKEVIAFANDVRCDFHSFIGSNKLTISAGMVLVSPKFPIQKAAELAEEALKQAKKNKNKNSFCLLDEVLNFEEWKFVYPLTLCLACLMDKNKTILPTALVFRFMDYKAIKDRGMLDWEWQSAYSFARHLDSENLNPEKKKWLKALMNALFTGEMNIDYQGKKYYYHADKQKGGKKRMLDLLAFAFKLAHLFNR